MERKQKKIAVLTQPLGKNYGGILQAYALQVILKGMGHQVWTVDRQHPKKDPQYLKKALSVFKRGLARSLLFKPMVVRIWPTQKELKTIYQHNQEFLKRYVQRTEPIDSAEAMSLLKKYGFDAYIVGSDQVWRPKYSPYIPNFFLDFLSPTEAAKRIAYAASFGVDTLEYSTDQMAVCAPLAKRFDAISVRENTAVLLCREHFGVNATHVLDPTLLLSKEHYVSLIEKEKAPPSKGTLMTYVLDKAPEKQAVIEQVARERGLKAFTVYPKTPFYKVGSRGIQDCMYPPLGSWIRGFMDCQYVVTDSFHGTAFAIIFNKPFIAIGNASRGLSRFQSLLNMFGLCERLIINPGELTAELINKPIDFTAVNQLREEKTASALNFLKNALK